MKSAFGVIASIVFLSSCAQQGDAPLPATPAAPDEAAILDRVDEFFIALGAGDADAFEAMHTEGSMAVVVLQGNEKAVRYSPVTDTLAQMRSGAFPVIRERYWDPVVLQRGDLAVVWTPYLIDVDGKRLHCGVDQFNMTRHDGVWMFDSVSFTVEPDACDEVKPREGVATRPDFSILDGD